MSIRTAGNRTCVWVVDPNGVITPAAPAALSLLTAADAVPDAAAGCALVVAGARHDNVYVATSGGVATAETEDLDVVAERAKAFAEESRASATRKAYKGDWAHFEAWTRRHGLTALPATPDTVGAYLVTHADALAISTLTRRLSSLVTAHRLAGYVLDLRNPAVRDVWRGIRRTKGTAQRHAEALTTPLLKRLLATCGTRLIDLRDRALLLVGFAGAFRRAELCALTMADVTVSPEGLTIRLARSKGDQEAEGAIIVIGRTGTDSCPAAAFEAWLAAAGITDGCAFRAVTRHDGVGKSLSAQSVAQIVKARATAAGLDPRGFSGHSLRAGFATAAAAVGIEEREIMRQTRHRSVLVARRYIRAGSRWSRNLAAEVGL